MTRKKSLTLLQKINPINKEEERRKFFFDPLYNPQFEYQEEIELEEWLKYGSVQTEYLPNVKKILDTVIHQWGSELEYLEKTEGKLLSQDEVLAAINKYLVENNLTNKIQVQFSHNQIARTAFKKGTLLLRLPVQYREATILGMLNHEIGTHYFRRVNEDQQPWKGHRRDFGFGGEDGQQWLETEEGLAVINSHSSVPDKHIWFASLAYYSTCLAEELSFSELFRELKKYTSDWDRRWSLCMKAKRGLKDSSLPGAFSKSQLYFSGTVAVARWLLQTDFAMEDLYLGKIALSDVPRAKEISTLPSVALPAFLTDREMYKQAVKEIIRVNKLESLI